MRYPRVIRREVAFAPAVYNGLMNVEGVRGVKAGTLDDISNLLKERSIPVVVDPECSVAGALNAGVVVDALLAKKNRGMGIDMAPLTIGLGPDLRLAGMSILLLKPTGGTIWEGLSVKGVHSQTRVFQKLLNGYGEERVLRAPCDGEIKNILNIGDQVKVDETVCYVGETEVRSAISGVLRGIIMNGVEVTRGLKIGDVDPRGIREYCFTVSDKARAIGGGVLEAILSVRQGITGSLITERLNSIKYFI